MFIGGRTQDSGVVDPRLRTGMGLGTLALSIVSVRRLVVNYFPAYQHLLLVHECFNYRISGISVTLTLYIDS